MGGLQGRPSKLAQVATAGLLAGRSVSVTHLQPVVPPGLPPGTTTSTIGQGALHSNGRTWYASFGRGFQGDQHPS